MAKLTTIDSIPLFTTPQEALSWASENGCSGYHTHVYQGQTGYMGCLSHSQLLEDKLFLNIPTQSSETIYHVYFENIGSTNYDSHLPTEDNPWVINQLVNPTITFRFDNQKGYIYEKTTTKTHSPGETLDSGSINDGKIPITITTTALRGGMSLKNSTVSVENIDVVYDDVVIKSTDLIASVSGNVGTITGTVTIGKSSKRDGDILFNPDYFFTIT